MKIAVLGTGCARCRQTLDAVRRAVEEAGVEASVVKVEDIAEIVKYRVLKTPAVVIDGEVKIAGRVPTVEDVKALLRGA